MEVDEVRDEDEVVENESAKVGERHGRRKGICVLESKRVRVS